METVLEDFTPAVLARAIEANAIEGCRTWGAWPGLEVHEEEETLWTLSQVPFPLFNNVLTAGISPDRVAPVIEAALDRARGRGVPMAWWTGPSTRPADLGDHLEAAGFFKDTAAGMAIDLRSLAADRPPPPTFEIEEVRDEQTLETWTDVLGPVFEFPDFAARAWFEMYAATGFGPQRPWRHFLGRLGGNPVATSSLFLGARVAGVSSVAVLAHVRRQGIGSAITTTAFAEARRLGYRIGTLFSSQEGEDLYRRLGFREYCQGGCYIWLQEEEAQ